MSKSFLEARSKGRVLTYSPSLSRELSWTWQDPPLSHQNVRKSLPGSHPQELAQNNRRTRLGQVIVRGISSHLGCQLYPECLKGHIPNWGSRPGGGDGRGGDAGIWAVKLVQPPPSSGSPSAGVALSQQAKAAPPQANSVSDQWAGPPRARNYFGTNCPTLPPRR